jgi:HKD family nuclease
MDIILLGQGFESTSKNSVGNQLIRLFSQKKFHSFTGISAFSSQAGIKGLSKYISLAKKYLKNITIITGIDQKGTSKEALEALLQLNISAFVFYVPSRTIFHPKIYLFEGKEESELIIGSSNLTSQGLFTNVETSLLIKIDNNNVTERKIIEQLKDYFKGIFNVTDPNLISLSEKLIADLLKAKIIPTEAERKATQDKLDEKEKKETEDLISTIFPKRVIAKIPSDFKSNPKTNKTISKVIKESNIHNVNEIVPNSLIWQKISLSKSDAQQVPPGTNPTGNLKLSQARFKINNIFIDQTTYFRNQVFNKLNWAKTISNKNSYEEANCKFNIIILEKDFGILTLKLSHDPGRIANQGNTPTWLHWGEILLKYLGNTNITSRALKLYAPSKGSVYKIVIV